MCSKYFCMALVTNTVLTHRTFIYLLNKSITEYLLEPHDKELTLKGLSDGLCEAYAMVHQPPPAAKELNKHGVLWDSMT